MKHINESIIGRKDSMIPKSLLKDFDIVQTANGEFWIVVFDKKIRKKYADNKFDIYIKFVLLGSGYIPDYEYDDNLEFSNEAGRGYDLDVVGIWRADPEYVKSHISDIFDRKNIKNVQTDIEILKMTSIGTSGQEIWHR